MLNPPFLPKYSRFSRSPAVTKSGTIYYPIWHAYATGILEQEGHDVKLVDAPADGLEHEECKIIARNFQPEMAVIYTSTPSIKNDVEVAASIKDNVKDCYILLAGPHVSALPEESIRMNSNIDAVVRHEYDFTLLELAKVLPNTSGLENVKGLTFRKGNEIINTPKREFVEDLDSIPFISKVYKKHLNYKNYFYAHCRYPIISIFTSRGCNAKCTWCHYPQMMFGQKARQRSAENIVAEFEYIESEFPDVKEVLIDDDTFIFSKEFAQEFSELMIKKKIKIPWTVECRANVKYESMVIMKKAGCRLIVVGFESSNDKILKDMKKGMTLKRMKQFVADAKRAKVMIHACFMAGNKGETKETLRDSLEFAKEINADTCQFFPMMVYPGTEDYEWAKKNNYLEESSFEKWLSPEGMHNCVVSTPELSSSELVDFCNLARREYYLRPRYLLSKTIQMFTDPGEIVKTIKAAKTFFRYLF